jgi:hypothetical protein
MRKRNALKKKHTMMDAKIITVGTIELQDSLRSKYGICEKK